MPAFRQRSVPWPIRILACHGSLPCWPGFLAGLAGFLLASWQMAITSNQGSSYLLYAIAAPIIGGVSVFGGRGNVRGVLGGVLLLTVIQVGLAIINVPSFYVGMIGGVMIFIAVAIDAVRVRHFG